MVNLYTRLPNNCKNRDILKSIFIDLGEGNEKLDFNRQNPLVMLFFSTNHLFTLILFFKTEYSAL